MGKMHELLAVEADVNNAASKLTEEAISTLAGKPDHFKGQTRSVRFLDEDRVNENTQDSKNVVTNVDDKLAHVANAVAKSYDVNLQKDKTNQLAKADLVVNGTVLAKDLPATFLLSMETRLKHLRALFQAVPTLEPSIDWKLDESAGKGIYRSPPITSFKTEKKVEYVTLAQPTDKHPAQVKDWTVDHPVARIETTHFSGMWTVARKAEVLDRLDALLYGVKEARMRANLVEIQVAKIGQDIFKYLLG